MKRTPLKRRKLLKRSGRLRPVSKKRAKQNREYSELRKKFLEEHPECIVAKTLWGCGYWTTEIHHRNGRSNEKLNDTTYWLAVSRPAHEWIHQNSNLAREYGWLI